MARCMWFVREKLWTWVAHPVHLLSLRVDDAVIWLEGEIEERYPKPSPDWRDWVKKEKDE